MAFGSVRKPYSARANFFADGSTADNRINWYIVPDDTPRYPGFTAFYPRVIHPADKANTIFEQEGAGRFVRRYLGNELFFPPPAHEAHGDDDDYQGRSLKAKYFVGDVAPEPPCNVRRGNTAGIDFGARLVVGGFARGTIDAGLTLGARAVSPSPRTATAGLRMGGALLKPAVKVARAGARLGDVLASPLRAGVWTGARAVKSDRTNNAGVRLGAELAPGTETPTIDAAFRLGAELDQAALELGSGFELGAQLMPGSLDLTAGIRVGAELDVETPTLAAGLALGAACFGLDQEAGLALGALLSDATGEHGAGLAFGGELVSDEIDLDAGLALGAQPTLGGDSTLPGGIGVGGTLIEP